MKRKPLRFLLILAHLGISIRIRSVSKEGYFINNLMDFNADIRSAFERAKIKGARFFEIGRSVLGRPILCVHVGNMKGPQLIVHGAIHAREWVTALLVCRQIEFSLKIVERFKNFGGIYFIPMVNPDGVDIALNGTANIKNKTEIEAALKGKDFRLFKANANLVDLNVNFDARWGEGQHNVRVRGTENFIGEYPHSEPEVKALVEFTEKVKPVFTISYHSKGEEIYYKFFQEGIEKKVHLAIAQFVAAACGYPVKTPEGSVGGYKDWCVEKFGIPSVTIEVGHDDFSHPLGAEHLPRILRQQLKVPVLCLVNFVRCDIILSCQNFQESRKKNLCKLRFWKASVRRTREKFLSVL